MSPLSLLLLLLFFAAVTSSRPTTTAANPTAYEVLESYDLPVGLLPKGALGYELDRATGRFSARLNGSCAFSIRGSYQLRYATTISGRISRGRLEDLKGITVKFLFIWINIIEVTREGEKLEFSVGIASADFAVENFDECPQCGCGMDCDGLLGGHKGEQMMELRRIY